VLEAFPQASILVRAYDRVHLMELDKLDIAFAQREMFESAVTMGRAALKMAGLKAEEVDRVDREYRKRDYERLERQSAAGDLHAGLERSFGPDRALGDDDGLETGEEVAKGGPIEAAPDEGPADPVHKNED
jgi:hypothetical protein